MKNFVVKASQCVLIVIAIIILMTMGLYSLNFGRVNAPRTAIRYEHSVRHFYSGQNRLTGYIFGEENDQGVIVISHGLGGGGLSYMMEISYFTNQGWRVFTFDKTGSHASEGRGTRGLPQSAIDLDAALTYIANQNWDMPVMLYGHSWGGFAVTAVLNMDHDISAVVSIAGFAEPLPMLQEGARLMVGPAAVLFTPFLWTYQRLLFGRYADLSAIEGINSGEVPVKIIHGRDDNVVSYDGAGIIAHRGQIVNPNVIFVSRYYPKRSGHVDLMREPGFLAEVNEFFVGYFR